jgi:hypothetical protein
MSTQPSNADGKDSTPPDAAATPPKSVERIRAKLESIREQAPSAAKTGPLADGLKPDDRIVIASFHDREGRQRYQDALLANGISSSWQRRNRQDQVLVDMSDRVQAARLLDEQLAAFPDRPQARGRRVVDFILLGAVLGATISVAFVADRSFARSQARMALIVTTAIAFTVYGAMVGGLLGSVRERLTRRGRLQFTILDLLLLSAVVALAALFWRLRF